MRLQFHTDNQRFRAKGLNQSQVSLLIQFDRTDVLSQTDLARGAGSQKAAMGTLLDGLEGKRLIEHCRGSEDRRVQRGSITDAGRGVTAEVDEMAAPLGHAMRAGRTRRARMQLISAGRKCERGFGAMSE